MTTPSASHISKTLAAAGIRRSVTGRGRICSMSSEGFTVTKTWKDEVVVSYYNRTGSTLSYEQFEPKYAQAMQQIKDTLTAKGYVVTLRNREYLVEKVGA
jgi:hypothetical protein